MTPSHWLIDKREWIISHLSWITLFLGFHTLGIYCHNDGMLAICLVEKQIVVLPLFAQSIQYIQHYNIPSNGITTNILPIYSGDLIVHHAIALGLHTTSLILLKGALNARSSKLMPDKKHFGFSFPCDGPGRGGT